MSLSQQHRRNESGELPDVGADAPRVAFVYPNTYAVGMSSLGYQTSLHQMRLHGLDAQRHFALDGLESVESGIRAVDADHIAFSIAYELDWLHVLQFLKKSGLPLHAAERGPDSPLIFAGGICVMMNRAPGWPFVDFFIHGEAEAVVPGLAEVLRSGLSRREMIERLVQLPGLEISGGCAKAYGLGEMTLPGMPAPPVPLVLSALDEHPCMTRLFSPDAEFKDMGLLCIARGCPNHCTFCWIGHNSPEYRTVPFDRVMEWAEWQLRFTDRIGLVASAVGAHPQIDDICRELIKRGARLSYSSLRVEEVTPVMLEALAQGGQKSITIAPEAGSLRVRRLLGKNIPDARFLEVVDWALQQGMLSIKLYFMTGIPTETDDEADEIGAFVEAVRERMLHHGKSSGQIGSISVNLGLFVQKPNLPLLKLEGDLEPSAKSARLKRLVRLISRIPNTRVMASSPELSRAQEILSMEAEYSSEFLWDVYTNDGNWRHAVRRDEKSRKN